MSTVYTQNSQKGSILSQRMDAYNNVEDVLSCKDELFLQQSTLEDLTDLYDGALQARKGVFEAGVVVNDRAKDVIASKEKMAKIDVMRSQNISKETVFVWIKSIGELLYSSFPKEAEKVTEIMSVIEGSALGTGTREISENELWAEMFETVPLCIDSEEEMKTISI